MAKKRHHKKHPHKRRMSGMGREGGLVQTLVAAAGVGAGVILGRIVNNMANPSTATTTTVSPTILGAAEFVGGAFIAGKMKKPGMMNTVLKAAALGLAGNGFMYALSSKGLNVLPATIGYGPDLMHRPTNAQLTGFRDVPKIGFPRPGVIGTAHDRARMRRAAGVYG